MRLILIFLILPFLFGFSTPSSISVGIQDKIYGTWVGRIEEPVPDGQGITVVISVSVTYASTMRSISRMNISFEHEGESVPAAGVRVTGSWNVRSYGGKNYLVEEIIDCNDTFNKMPEALSPCDDITFIGGDIDQPSEILFVNEKQLVLKYNDIATGEDTVINLEKV